MHLGKYVRDSKGLCANLHHAALGIWPATHAAELKAGRSAPVADSKKSGTDVGDQPASASRAGTQAIRRDCQLEDIHIVRAAEGGSSGRVVEAYATVFNQPVNILDEYGNYTEIIERGAFDQILAHIRRSPGGLAGAVRVLYNHGKTMEGGPAPEFQKPLGKPLSAEVETRGLLTRTEYSKTPLAEEVLELIRDGAITTQSFEGALIRSDPELRGPGDRYRARNGVKVTVRRMILGLREYGPVLWAAYTGAEILGVRSQLPGSVLADDGPDLTPDEEYGPDDEAAVTGGVPEDTTSARYHQHALYRLRSQEARKEKGLDW
jgi:HK97 family phage prohead protease